jgi:hypothetical protein
MSYSEACEVLKLTTPKSLAANYNHAALMLRHLKPSAPLRLKVACQVVMDEVRK